MYSVELHTLFLDTNHETANNRAVLRRILSD